MEFYIKLSNNISQKNSIKLSTSNPNNSAYETLNDLIQAEFGLSTNDYDLTSTSGVLIKSNNLIQNGQTFQICPKVLGGKVSLINILSSSKSGFSNLIYLILKGWFWIFAACFWQTNHTLD